MVVVLGACSLPSKDVGDEVDGNGGSGSAGSGSGGGSMGGDDPCHALQEGACTQAPDCDEISARELVDGCPVDGTATYVACVPRTACETDGASVCEVDGVPRLIGPNVCDLPPAIAQTCEPWAGEETCEGGDTEGEIDAECNSPAPNTMFGYDLALGTLPGADEFEVDLRADCTIQTAQVVAGEVQYGLSCRDGDGESHAVRFDIVGFRDGHDDVSAAVGRAAELRVKGVQDFGGLVEGPLEATGLAAENLALIGDDGQVFALVVSSFAFEDEVIAPWLASVDRDACGTDLPPDDPNFPGPDRDMAIELQVGEENVRLHSGQAATLEVPGADGVDHVEIDAGRIEAIECCHNDAWIAIVARSYRVPAA
jgi:hypothetical protein